MPGPSATLTELQALYGEKYRWLLLLAVMVGTMAAIMSSTIINVAVPDMSRHFGLGQERVRRKRRDQKQHRQQRPHEH